VLLGRVIGSLTSTINHASYDAKTLLVVERIAPNGLAHSDYLVAVDTVGAGIGEHVLVLDEGGGARQVLGSKDAPVRSVIVGIVDHAG
jgi:ethanolamine utilization protein EutN